MDAAAKTTITPEVAVAVRDMFLDFLSGELQTTRKVLAAVPADQADYRPDPKSRTASELAWHIASVDVQFCEEIAEGKFNMEPRYKDPVPLAELPEWYEQNLTRAIEKLRATTPAQLLTPVNFFGAFNFPAYQYLLFLNNHSVHHRGQLAAYLRPMGSKVPSIYGGSADVEWAPPTAA